MNHRMIQPLVALSFVALTAFLIADMANIWIRRSVKIYPAISILEVKGEGRMAPPPPPPPVENYEAEMEGARTSGLRLIGTVSGTYPTAVILDFSNIQGLYRLRDHVGDGWQISSIEKNRVVIRRGKESEVLEVGFMEPEQLGMKSASASTTTSQRKGIKIESKDVQAALADLNKVVTQARVVPNIEAGKTTGYRIFNIVPDSIYTRIGLQNNDIVERVNGVEIKSPDNLYQLFNQIKNESRITLDFSRNGRRESVNIEIR